jgi:hypothetical protein
MDVSSHRSDGACWGCYQGATIGTGGLQPSWGRTSDSSVTCARIPDGDKLLGDHVLSCGNARLPILPVKIDILHVPRGT